MLAFVGSKIDKSTVYRMQNMLTFQYVLDTYGNEFLIDGKFISDTYPPVQL